MNRCLLAVLLMALPAHFSRTQQQQNSVEPAIVTISLPESIPSETIQIHYFLIGSFGGYGGFIEPRPNQTDYEIDATTQGKPADSIKILVYATGCKFQTFDLDLLQVPNPKVSFVCEPLPKIRIEGEIPSAMGVTKTRN